MYWKSHSIYWCHEYIPACNKLVLSFWLCSLNPFNHSHSIYLPSIKSTTLLALWTVLELVQKASGLQKARTQILLVCVCCYLCFVEWRARNNLLFVGTVEDALQISSLLLELVSRLLYFCKLIRVLSTVADPMASSVLYIWNHSKWRLLVFFCDLEHFRQEFSFENAPPELKPRIEIFEFLLKCAFSPPLYFLKRHYSRRVPNRASNTEYETLCIRTW